MPTTYEFIQNYNVDWQMAQFPLSALAGSMHACLTYSESSAHHISHDSCKALYVVCLCIEASP